MQGLKMLENRLYFLKNVHKQDFFHPHSHKYFGKKFAVLCIFNYLWQLYITSITSQIYQLIYSKKAPKDFQRYLNYHIYSLQGYFQQRHPNSTSPGSFNCTLLASNYTAKTYSNAAPHLLKLLFLHDAYVKWT